MFLQALLHAHSWASCSYPKLGADSWSAPLSSQLQSVFTVAARNSFKEVIDEIQPAWKEKYKRKEKTPWNTNF